MQIPLDTQFILDIAEHNHKVYSKKPIGISIDDNITDCFLNIYTPDDFKDFTNIVFNSSLNCSFTITNGFLFGPSHCSNIWIDTITANYDQTMKQKKLYTHELKTILLTDDITKFPSIIHDVLFDKTSYKDIVIDTSNCSNQSLITMLYNFLITYHQRACRVLSTIDLLHLIEHLIVDIDDRIFEIQLPFGKGDLMNVLNMEYADCRIRHYGVSNFKVKKSLLMFGCPSISDIKTLALFLDGKSIDIIKYSWCEDQCVGKNTNKFVNIEPYFMGVFPSSKLVSPNYGIVEYHHHINTADSYSLRDVSHYVVGNSSNWDYSRKSIRNVGCSLNYHNMNVSTKVYKKPITIIMSNFARDVVSTTVNDFSKIFGNISVASVTIAV